MWTPVAIGIAVAGIAVGQVPPEIAKQLVTIGRGSIRVTDRAGLKRRSCECYQRLEDHFAAVIGAGGRGAA